MRGGAVERNMVCAIDLLAADSKVGRTSVQQSGNAGRVQIYLMAVPSVMPRKAVLPLLLHGQNIQHVPYEARHVSIV